MPFSFNVKRLFNETFELCHAEGHVWTVYFNLIFHYETFEYPVFSLREREM